MVLVLLPKPSLFLEFEFVLVASPRVGDCMFAARRNVYFVQISWLPNLGKESREDAADCFHAVKSIVVFPGFKTPPKALNHESLTSATCRVDIAGQLTFSALRIKDSQERLVVLIGKCKWVTSDSLGDLPC